jgi:hypothetical protein
MKNEPSARKTQTRREFVTGWFPVKSPSTHALIWRSLTASGTVFQAEIMRFGQKVSELKAGTVEDLAGLLAQEIGPAPKSLVRLGSKGSSESR